jgi:putative peptidoglycan lipid II flippase
MTQRALIAYSVGLLAIILIKVLAPGFYAQQNIRTPVKIAIFTLVCTQLFNLALVGPLAHAGLALAISPVPASMPACCSGSCAAADVQPQPGWLLFLLKLVAVGLMSACCCGHALYAGLGSGHMLERFLRLGA